MLSTEPEALRNTSRNKKAVAPRSEVDSSRFEFEIQEATYSEPWLHKLSEASPDQATAWNSSEGAESWT